MTSSAPGSLTGERIGPWERACGALRVAVGTVQGRIWAPVPLVDSVPRCCWAQIPMRTTRRRPPG